MNTMSLKEKAVAATLGVIALYIIAALTWFMHAESAWKKAAKRYDDAKTTYRKELKLIGEKRALTEAYEAKKTVMPTFETGKATDTIWLQKMDDLAAKHNLLIGQRQGGKEIEAGDVLELPVEVKSWEGSLESLVRFMHALENSDEGMFDITQISFKPSSKKGYLRGSFTLNCAYMREDDQ